MNIRVVKSALLSLILLATFWSSSALAVEPITMEVASPLMTVPKPLTVKARLGRWFPIAVTLSNTGDAVQGRLTLRVITNISDGVPNSEFYTDVDLPANASRKRVWIYGRLEREDVDEFEIRFQGRGFRGMKVVGRIETLEPQTRSVLTISDVDEKLNYLKSVQAPGFAVAEEKTAQQTMAGTRGWSPPGTRTLNSPDTIAPLGVSHEFVPPRWIGLDAVDMVVLHDFPHTSLTPAQLAALRNYVAGGGSLLALGGTDWQRLAQSPLADLWPVTPKSSSTASSSEVSELVQRYMKVKNPTAGDRLGGAPVVLTRGTLRPEAAFGGVTEADSSLLARRSVGAGHVLFMYADPTKPPFLGWSGNAGLWSAVFAAAPRVPRMETIDTSQDENYYARSGRAPGLYGTAGVDTSLTSSLLRALASAKQLKTPPVSFIAWFLALYVFFLVPVNYCVLRYFDKRELAWVTIPIIVVAFSVMSYAAALKIKGNAILLRQVNMVQGVEGSGTARADAMLWLFSPRKTTYDVGSKDPNMVVADYIDTKHANSSVGSIVQPDENSSFTLEDAAINMWDSRSFVGSSVINIGQGITLKESDNKIVVQNNTDLDLKGAVVAGENRLITVGEIKRGSATAPVEVDMVGQAAAQYTDKIIMQSRLDAILPQDERDNFRNIGKALLSNAVGSKYADKRGGSLLIAWIQEPAAPLTIGYDDTRARSLSLFVFRLHDSTLLRRFREQKMTPTKPSPAMKSATKVKARK